MADAKTTYLSNALLNAVLRNIAFTSPATVYVGLHTAQANPEAGVVTEVTGGSYARQSAPFAAAAAGICANNADISFPIASAPWGTIMGAGISDAVTVGNLLYYGVLTVSKTINTSDQFKFLTGALSVQEQ